MEWLGVAELIVSLLGICLGFVYRTLKEADSNNKSELLGLLNTYKSELTNRINKMEETLNKSDSDIEMELARRIDKLEENSRRDDETVKQLIKESEGRMGSEIEARIRNIVELHQKAERIYDTMLAKFETLLDRVAKLEGKIDK